MVQLSMTLSDLWPRFQGHDIFWSRISEKRRVLKIVHMEWYYAAAWLIFRIRRSEHITAALISLHWLRVPERILFKQAVLTYRSIHGTSPGYLQSCFTRVAQTWLWDDGCGLLHLSGLMYQPSVSPQSAGGRFRSLAPTFVTICRHTWHPHSHSRFSDNDSRHSCSPVHIRTFLFDLLSDILRGPCNSYRYLGQVKNADDDDDDDDDVWWPWLTSKWVAWVCQHQLSFLFYWSHPLSDLAGWYICGICESCRKLAE